MTQPTDVWPQVHALLARYDSDFQLTCRSHRFWEGQLRLTLTDEPGIPSRSVTFYRLGAKRPESIARDLLNEAARWIAENGEPMPIPDWMIPWLDFQASIAGPYGEDG